ncbi:polymorphic toxin-type HINT domain-containing protein [Acetivibrio clariflavus]|uniref:polymorphic toxin-type HINT domain-containing protein n=1 Tax=Acetivibrio clariflavus TaxID=288965 RepID=UPI00211EA367|nr:polymorphic toxin-type HINT domain-containing protein [Acetivibrio clariflavus]
MVTKVESRQIKDIQVGYKGYSENLKTGEKGLKKVTNVFVSETDTLIHVFAGDEEICTTTTHPFWVEGKGWINAGYLAAGEKLKLYKSELLEFEKI